MTEDAVWAATSGGGGFVVAEDGLILPARAVLNFAGNVTAVDNPGQDRIDVTAIGVPGPPGSPGSVNLQENGSPLPTRANLNFGAGIVASDNPVLDRTDVAIASFPGVGDGVHLADASITAGSAVLSSPSAPFTSADIGKIVAVIGAGSAGAGKGFTISGFTSSTQVTLDSTATTTVSGGHAFYGTNNSNAFTAAFAAIPNGGVIQLDSSIYMVGSTVVIPGGVMVRGTGYSYPGSQRAVDACARIVAGGAISSACVKVGDSQAGGGVSDPSYGPTHSAPKLRDCIVYGCEIVTQAVWCVGARHLINYCDIWGGSSLALRNDGQNGYTVGCIIRQNSRGTCVQDGGVGDNKYYRNQIRGFKADGVDLNAAHVEFCQNHVYSDSADETSATGPYLKISGAGQLVSGNVFGNTNFRQPNILVVASASSGFNVNIVGNHFYQTGMADKIPPAIRIDTTAAILHGLCIAGNNFEGSRVGTSRGYKSMVDVIGNNAVMGWSMTGNMGLATFAFVTAANAQSPIGHSGNAITYDDGAGFVESAF